MTVCFYGSERHYLDHLWPVFNLGTQVGLLWGWSKAEMMGSIVVVSSYKDMMTARRAGAAKVVLMQHGAGQSYSNRNASYPGGNGHQRADLVLMPNEQAAARHRKFYPKGPPVEVVGCPKLDEWAGGPPKPRSDPPVVVISFHWRCHVSREAGTVWDDYGLEAIEQLWSMDRAGEIQLGVHAHPRIEAEVRDALIGKIPVGRFVGRFADVVEHADLYVMDNSSTIFEFAALDRPVVLMDSPRWRCNIDHGGRFWEWSRVGPRVERASDVAEGVRWALSDDPMLVQNRREVVAEVYPHLGDATMRAVRAITALEEP